MSQPDRLSELPAAVTKQAENNRSNTVRAIAMVILGIMTGVTGLHTQGRFSLLAGVSLATLKFEDDDIADEYNFSAKMGLNAGAETRWGPYILGLSFVQRGALAEPCQRDAAEESSFREACNKEEWYILLNYLSGHIAYSCLHHRRASVLVGAQAGLFLSGRNGRIGADYPSNIFRREDYALDYGMLLGLDIGVIEHIGTRITYYLGFSNVQTDDFWKYKNRGVGVILLYNM